MKWLKFILLSLPLMQSSLGTLTEQMNIIQVTMAQLATNQFSLAESVTDAIRTELHNQTSALLAANAEFRSGQQTSDLNSFL